MAATTARLLGPPSFSHGGLRTPAATYAAVVLQGSKSQNGENAVRGFTENRSATFLATGNPCLDFFFKVVPDTPSDSLIELLKVAWTFNPLLTVKLICNLRGVRGTGKSGKEGFYAAALWLHRFHPKTLACNVKAIAEFGYFKDFLEILYRILEGPTVRKVQKEERLSKRKEVQKEVRGSDSERGKKFKSGKRFRKWKEERGSDSDWSEDQELADAYEDPYWLSNRLRRRYRTSENIDYQIDYGKIERKPKASLRSSRHKRSRPNYQGINNQLDYVYDIKRKRQIEEARALRKEKEINKAKKALEKYNGDEAYRRLYDSVASFFGELLKADVEKLKSGELNEISLAAKWCPTIDSSYDKALLICESIARKVFPRENYPEYEGLEERHYVYRVRDRLRKEILVPLHKALELPEVYMSADKWNTLPYNRVGSVAMEKYQKLFSAHDKERFDEYLEKVKSGKAKIAAGALLPHQIIGAVNNKEKHEVAELQWKRLVDDMKQKGKLSNCIAVCDVSASMNGTPMQVSVALGILVSELSEEPWKGKVITFSEKPQIHKVEGSSLLEKTWFVKNMDWGGSTNFQGVFDRILEISVKKKVKDDQMVKRVFVFSDMEFNQASRNPWETDFQAIQRKYSQWGYKSVPEIVFWNLRDSRSIPVAGKEKGVALVSGFSKNLLNLFLDKGGIVNPVEVMEHAVSGEEYKKLVVFD